MPRPRLTDGLDLPPIGDSVLDREIAALAGDPTSKSARGRSPRYRRRLIKAVLRRWRICSEATAHQSDRQGGQR